MISIYDVLKASKGVHVDDIFAELWGRKLSNAYTVETYIGTLPATLTGTKAGYLESYKIYGNTVQDGTPTPENLIVPSECGERTENLFDKNAMVVPVYLDAQYGTYRLSNGNSKSALIRCLPNTDYSFTAFSRTFRVSFFDHKPADNDSPLSRYIYDFSTYGTHSRTVSSPSSAQYAVLFFYNSSIEALDYTVDDILSTVMIVEGSTAPTSYEPYGYKLPLLSGSTPVDIYIGDDTLSTEEYVDSGTGKIYRMVSGVLTPTDPPVPFPQIPTSANSTTISWAGQGLAPSEVELTYRKSKGQ